MSVHLLGDGEKDWVVLFLTSSDGRECLELDPFFLTQCSDGSILNSVIDAEKLPFQVIPDSMGIARSG